MSSRGYLLFLLPFLWCATATETLRAQIAGGNIAGVVSDPSGAPVRQAKVVLRNRATSLTRALNSNGEGLYAAPDLAPGEYEITVSAVGFQTQIAEITLTVGADQQLNFGLQLGSLEQTIEVRGHVDGVDLATSAIQAVVSQKTVQDLPLNGRSWTDLAAMEPAVVPVEAQPSYTAGNSRGNRGFGAQLAISGGRPQQNNYRLDGISINDYSNGGPGSVLGGNLGVDAIQEFSLVTTNSPATYGRASGGIINASTRAGAPGFHGSAYEFIRNSDLDARNFFDKASPPPFRRNQFGVSAGSALIPGKTFIFGDYEGIRQSTGVTNLVAFSNAINGLPWYNLKIGRGVSDFNVPRVAVLNGIWNVPAPRAAHGLVNRAGAGWQLSAIFKASDGIPFTPLIAGDPLGQRSAAPFDFPNRLTGPGCESAVNPGNPALYIRTQCFAFPNSATLLGDSGRNVLTGPGLVNLDLSLVKNISIRSVSETFRAQIRADVFNTFNRANFLPPLDILKLFDAAGRTVPARAYWTRRRPLPGSFNSPSG